MKVQKEKKTEQKDTEQRIMMPKEDSLEGLSRKEKMAREKAKLKEMNWKQKIGYIWDYYKFIFVIIIGVLLLCSIIRTSIHNMGIEQVIQAAFLNCDYLGGDALNLGRGFEDYLGGLEDDQELDLDYSLSVDFDSMDTATTAATIKIMAYMSDGTLDCMIMPENVYLHYLENGAFQALDQVLSREELKEWEEYLDTERTPEEGAEGIYGIRVDKAEKLEESGLYPDSVGTVYMAFPSGSSRIGMSVELLHYLMGDEPAAETEKVEAETAEGTTESRN